MSMDYTSIFVHERLQGWEALIDMEMTYFCISFDYRLTKNLALSLDVPFVSMNSGFLDNFLEIFHTTFGLPNYGKKRRPKDEFAYFLKKNDRDLFEAQSGGFHLVDSSISVKFSLLDEKQSGIASASLLYRLKMPTGKKEHGFGSGRYDHGLFLLSKIRFNPISLYLNPGIMFLSEAETIGSRLPVNTTVFGLIVGCEYPLSKSWSLLAQVNYYTSPFKDRRIPPLDDDSLQLIMGTIYELTPGMSLEFSFSEDLSWAAPDFTVHARMTFGISL